MIDFTIVLSIVVALAIFNLLDIFSDYVTVKINTYRFKKSLTELEYNYGSWLNTDWNKDDCCDDCDICDEMDEPAKKPVKKAVKKTAKKKAPARKK
jgi:hypothetical protein